MTKSWQLISVGMLCSALGQSSTISIYAAEHDISIRGSTTIFPIAQIAAETFMDRCPNVKISVQGGGSGVGIVSLLEGACDIAISSRPAKGSEIREARNNGIRLTALVVAMDAIVVIVHPSNFTAELTKKQLKDIYTGRIINWLELGGKEGEIVPVSRDICSGTFASFSDLVLNNERIRLDILMQASNRAVASTVAVTPGAIGYVGMGYVSDKIKALALDGIIPSKETVRSKKYGLQRLLFMYTDGDPKGMVKTFLDFVLSEEGQGLVEKTGFIAVE